MSTEDPAPKAAGKSSERADEAPQAEKPEGGGFPPMKPLFRIPGLASPEAATQAPGELAEAPDEDKLAAEWAKMAQEQQDGVPDARVLNMDEIDSLLGFDMEARSRPTLQSQIRDLRHKYRLRRLLLQELGLTEKTAEIRQAEANRIFHGLSFLFEGRPDVPRPLRRQVFGMIHGWLKDYAGKQNAGRNFPYKPLIDHTPFDSRQVPEQDRAVVKLLIAQEMAHSIMFFFLNALAVQHRIPKYALNLWERVGSAWLDDRWGLEIVSHDYLD